MYYEKYGHAGLRVKRKRRKILQNWSVVAGSGSAGEPSEKVLDDIVGPIYPGPFQGNQNACPGRYANREPGSALIALEVALRHQLSLRGELTFWFIDADPLCIEDLQNELAMLPTPLRFRIHTRVGKFDQSVLQPARADCA